MSKLIVIQSYWDRILQQNWEKSTNNHKEWVLYDLRESWISDENWPV